MPKFGAEILFRTRFIVCCRPLWPLCHDNFTEEVIGALMIQQLKNYRPHGIWGLTSKSVTLWDLMGTRLRDKPTVFINTTSRVKNKTKTNKKCKEEQPSNIGAYEVPTERDILFFTRDLLLELFETYKMDAMSLLRDIKEVTKATAAIDKKCNNKTAYRECVKFVSGQSEAITKSLVTSIELEKLDVKNLTENDVCSLSEMKKDPIKLIKLMVQETVMLKFALPGFLRLLNSCNTNCKKSQAEANKKPLRRMTDQDLVVKYFLTKNKYVQLIKDSRRAV